MAHAVSRKRILESPDCNLSGDRYRPAAIRATGKWPMVKLGEVVDILDSIRRPITKSDRKSGPYPYYGATGIVDYVADYLFDEELVLVGEDGAKWASGEQTAFIVKEKCWVNNHAHVLRPIPSKIKSVFLTAILNEMDLSPFITGVTVPKLNQERLRSIEIPLPPLEEQERIVAELEGYRKVIEGARQIIANYKPTIQSDPKWLMVALGKAAEISMGQSPDGESYNDKGVGVPLINGPVEFGPTAFSQTLVSKFTTKPTKMCKAGDVILCVRGSTTGRMNIASCEACIGRGVAAIRSQCTLYVAYCLESMRDEIHALGSQSGSTFPNITCDRLSGVEIPLPPIDIQRRIVAELEAERKLVEANRELIARFEKKIQTTLARVWGEEVEAIERVNQSDAGSEIRL